MAAKKRGKKDFLLIEGTVYPFDVLVTTEGHGDVLEHIANKGYDLSEEEKSLLEMEGVGRTTMLKGGQVVIRLRKEKTKIGIDVPTLSHEISHATYFILSRIGIKHTDESDEAFAYLNGYFMKKCLDHYDI